MTKSIFQIILILACLTACNDNQTKRIIISLNGTWKVEEGQKNVIPERFNHTVKVPGLVSSAVPEFKNVGPVVKNVYNNNQWDSLREAFWYKLTFNLDKPVPLIARLKISKAMYGTKVFLNGKDLGEHLPCFTPGYFNLRDALKDGENELIIRIGSCRSAVPPGIPTGLDFERVRYIPGIIDDVEVILSGTPNIIRVQAAPDIYKKQVRVQVNLDNHGEAIKTKVLFKIRETKTQKLVGELVKEVNLKGNSSEGNIIDVKIPIKDCRLWSPEDPFLYSLEIITEGDEYQTRFGMREFRYDPATRLVKLNGKPCFLRGSNITLYRFFDDPLCKDLPWNKTWVRNLHKSFRQFHWNILRYCISLPPEEWYRIADEEGFLIQDEFPIWYGGKGWCKWPSELKTDELVAEYTEWMQERWNHPCVVIWDGSNETVSNDLKTEEIADAIEKIRNLDLSNRPWDNSYSLRRDTGDVLELHPYHFMDPGFKFSEIAKATANPLETYLTKSFPGIPQDENRYIRIVNEYGWLWLLRDGTPTPLTDKLYGNLLGKNSTVQQRRHLYATYMAAETEFWRCHRQCNAVMHFAVLAASVSGCMTSDHFKDVKKLVYDDEWLKYMPDAFSPVALMLDEWGNEIEINKRHDYKILAINDLEPEWNGFVRLQIIQRDTVVAEQFAGLTIPSYGQKSMTIKLSGPESPGIYTVIASLEKKSERSVKSIREIPFK